MLDSMIARKVGRLVKDVRWKWNFLNSQHMTIKKKPCGTVLIRDKRNSFKKRRTASIKCIDQTILFFVFILAHLLWRKFWLNFSSSKRSVPSRSSAYSWFCWWTRLGGFSANTTIATPSSRSCCGGRDGRKKREWMLKLNQRNLVRRSM